jgi:hypothetical protein
MRESFVFGYRFFGKGVDPLASVRCLKAGVGFEGKLLPIS